MSTLSVLMSVYAKEKPDCLDLALRSVWDDQTLKPDCIVLVEDGPLGSDLQATVGQWQARLGAAMVVLKNECNLGLTKSLNKGIDHISTDLIARMDSDDISRPQRFEHQVRFLREHPDVAVVGGDIEEFYPSGARRLRPHPYSPADVRRSICKASPMAHPTVMMRRSLFDGGLRYNERYRKCQDLDLWFRALASGHRLANLPEVVLDFRMSDDVYSRRGKEAARDEFRIYCRGIRSLYGPVSAKYAYPLTRYLFRRMPRKLAGLLYNSRLREGLVS